MIFKGKSGASYKIIEPAIGKGGEGSIYKIDGMPNFVLKVFSDSKRTEEIERKLLAMLEIPLFNNTIDVVWPKDVVYENEKFAGYVMPKISNNKHLNMVYVSSRNKYDRNRTIKNITVAQNLCVAINSIHNAEQICGDFNPTNITVNLRTGIVTLVDTDSYHITKRMVTKTLYIDAKSEYQNI